MPVKDKHNKKVPYFRDRRQFPESGSRIKQLRYLLMGLMPMIKQQTRSQVNAALSVLETVLHHARLATARRHGQVGVFLTASILIAVLAVFGTLYTNGTTVLVNGVEVATVSSREEAQAARLAVEQTISEAVGYE